MKKRNLTAIPLLLCLVLMSWVPLWAQQAAVICADIYGGDEQLDLQFTTFDDGNTYIVGRTEATDLPVTDGSMLVGGADYYIARIDGDCNLVFGTYFGSAGFDNDGVFRAPLVVESGSVHLVFESPAGADLFPVTDGSTPPGDKDLVYFKFDAANGMVQSGTYVGGSGNENLQDFDVENGEVFILATSNSDDYPVTDGSTRTSTGAFGNDQVLTKLDPNGNIAFSGFLAEARGTTNNAEIEVDANGVVIAAITDDSRANWPVTDGSTLLPGRDVIVAKYDLNINPVFIQQAMAITGNRLTTASLDLLLEDGEIYLVGGKSEGSYYASTDGTVEGGPTGQTRDVFALKLLPDGTLDYRTFLNLGDDSGFFTDVNNGYLGVIIGTDDEVQTTDGTMDPGLDDVAVAHLAPDGSLILRTQVGSDGFDSPRAVALDERGNLYLTGSIGSGSGFETTDGSVPTGADNFLVKYDKTGTLLFATDLGDSGPSESWLEVMGSKITITSRLGGNASPLVTDASQGTFSNRSALVTVLDLCPDFPTQTIPLSPTTQTVCQNGFVETLDGDRIVIPGTDLPTLYDGGVPADQADITASRYQWQEATSPAGPWTDIPGAIQRFYSPLPLGSDRYFRRQAFSGPCCGSALINTSEVAEVLVNANVAPTIEANNPYNTCPGTAVQLIPAVTGGTPGYTYAWDGGLDPIADPTVTPTETTVYAVSVTDAVGCLQVEQVLVNAYAADAGEDVSVCAGEAVTIGGPAIPGLTGVVYSWSPAAGLSCTDCPNPSVNPSTTQTYTLSLTIPVTNGATCTTTDDVLVTAVAPPSVPEFAGPDVTICRGETATLGTPAEAGFTYTWAPGNYLADNTTAEVTFQPGSLELPGPDPILYYVTAKKDGCFFVDDVLATVIDADADTDGCGPRSVGTPDPTPDIDETYEWVKISGPGNFTGPTDVPITSVSESVGGPTIYELRVSNDGVTCTDQVVVPEGCVCDVDIDVSTPASCPSFDLNNGMVTLNAFGVAGGGIPVSSYVYTWTVISGPAGGLDQFSGPSVNLTDNVQRTFEVTLTSSVNPNLSCSETIAVNDPAWSLPVFNAGDVNTCAGDPIAIGDVNVADYTYAWMPENGLDDPQISMPTATVSGTTVYQALVTDTRSGCTATADVTVNSLTVEALAGPDQLICDNGVVQLGGAADYPGATIQWSPTGASLYQNGTGPNDAQPEVLVTTPTTFTLTVTSTDAAACVSTDTVFVDVGTPVTPFSLASIDYCPGDGAVTLGTGVPAGFAEYSWSPAGPLDDPTVQMPVTNDPPPSGSTEFTVLVTNATGCEFSTTQMITPTSTAPEAGPSQLLCVGETALIGSAGNPTSGAVYSWSGTGVSDLSDPNSPQPTFTANSPGVYELTLTKTETGCATTDVVTITVNEYRLPAIPSTTICQNGSAQIGTTPEPGVTYAWSPTTGLSDPNVANPFVSGLTTTTNYQLTAIGANGCSDQATVIVAVNSTPAPTVSVPNITACSGDDNLVFMPDISPAGTYTYQWSPNDGSLSAVDVEMPEVFAFGTGTQEYALTVTDANGCSSVAPANLDVVACFSMPCAISDAGLTDISCDDGGTGTVDTDDFVTFSLNPVAENPGFAGTYTITASSGTVTPTTGTYGAPSSFQLDAGTAGGGDVMLTLTDSDNPSCSFMVTVTDPLSCSSECTLSLESITASCDFSTGNSVFMLDLTVNTIDAPAGEDLVVTFNGAEIGRMAPDVSGTTSFTGLAVTDDPSFNNALEVSFATTTTCSATSTVDLIACTPDCVDGAGTIGGNVFNDFDNDGADAGAGEVGQENVLVEVYDCDGVLVCSTYTNADGDWSCDGLTENEEYRVEFSTPLQPYLQPSYAGTDNGTNTQFVTAPSCEVDYGVINPADFCQDNPTMVMACYINGDNNNTLDAIVSWPFDSIGQLTNPGSTAKQKVSQADQVASVWGMAYDQSNRKVYGSAVLKRHVGLTTDGLGAIFEIDPFAGTPNGTLWLDVETLPGVDVGASQVGSNVARGLGSGPSYDVDAFSQIGKIGLGDIDLSDDGEILYAVNIHQKTLLAIEVATKTLIGSYPIPDPGCTNGVFRPWALEVKEGAVFVGGVCDASTGAFTDLTGYVYRFANGSFQSAPVLTFPLSYQRQFLIFRGGCENLTNFLPWTDDPSGAIVCENRTDINRTILIQPQPMFVDLQFTPGGDMVVGLADRAGLQWGNDNYYPDPTQTNTDGYSVVNGGDILKACATADNQWTIESRGSACSNDTLGGIDLSVASEFFNGEYFVSTSTADPSDPNNRNGHRETALGALAILPGSGEIIAGAFDPVSGDGFFGRGGVIFLDLNSGARTRQGTELYKGPDDTFGKGFGLGDVVAACDAPPIQIGNYVWEDTDEDGVQDACETPIAGVPVSLYNKDTDTFEDVQTTGVDGEYYFDDVDPNINYAIVFGYDYTSTATDGLWDATTGELTVGGTPYGLTTADADGTNPLGPDANDLNDSDATLMDMATVTQYPIISYTTADTTDHTLDVGLVPLAVFDLALVKRLDATATPGPFMPGSTVTYEIEVYNQGDTDATDVEVKDYVPTGLTLAPASAPDWTTSVDTAILMTPFSLAAGDSTTLSISFVIDADFMGESITNNAEISNYDDDGDPNTPAPEDEDSTPNDNGTDPPETGTNDEYADDYVNAPGTMDDPTDEDDFDPETIMVAQSFDLALTKVLDTDATPGPFTVGSPVTYTITVYNQGSLDATGVSVSDYSPVGLTLVAGGDWTDAGGNLMTLNTPFDLAAGMSQELTISFTIDADFTGTELINSAEISAASNALGLPDEDSSAFGDDQNTDPELGSDDNIDDDGLGGNGTPDDPADRDEFDPARIEIEFLSIGSTVFEDLNNNGVQDAGEAGIEGVAVDVYAAGATPGTDTPVGSDDTDVNGDYFVDGLVPGDYFVVISDANFGAALQDLPISSNETSSGFTETDPDDDQDNDDEGVQTAGPGTTVQSELVTLGIGEEPIDGTGDGTEFAQGNQQDPAGQDDNGNMTLDFGFFAPVSVGDTAFVDLDGDGLQTLGEPGIGGVTVVLLDGNGDTVTVDAEGNTITGVTTTDPDGSYGFDNLPPGSYAVAFNISTADNAEFYDFTLANAGDDTDDSDNSIALSDSTAQSAPTPFLNSGEEDLTLDVGVICAIEVTVAEPFTICATGTIDLLVGASVTPTSLGGTWSTPDGTGTFVDANGDPLTEPYELGTAAEYLPSSDDTRRGSVTLILTSNEPDGPCDAISAQVIIEILKVDCGRFMWDGKD